ncbi:MAG TPA: sigma factor, partial [Steroidobacteraceae bacterium]
MDPIPHDLRRHTPIFAASVHVALSVHGAEDVVQEILIGLHAKRHTWDETRPFLPWYTITRHRCRAPPAPRRVLPDGDHDGRIVGDLRSLGR